MNEEVEVYRVSEFCQHYKISRTSLYKEVNEKRLHLIKRGRRTLIARMETAKSEKNYRNYSHRRTISRFARSPAWYAALRAGASGVDDRHEARRNFSSALEECRF